MGLDDGADKFRDKWVPVPLLTNDYNADTKTYAIEFLAPKQLLLVENFEAMVHDELLRNADRRGLIVEGQVNVTTEDAVAKTDEVEEFTPDPEPEYKMSEAEKEMRARLRRNLQDTAEEAYGVAKATQEGKELPTGEKFRVDRGAFMEGFFGDALKHPTPEHQRVPEGSMKVRAEAFISVDLGESVEAEVIEHDIGIEVPDDLSGLDGIDE